VNTVSAGDVMTAIGVVATHLPDLAVIVADNCHGYNWHIGEGSTTIYVDGTLDPDEWVDSVLSALDALCLHHNLPLRHRRLHLIPSPREQVDNVAAGG
jgi:hypothetical protein